MTARLIGPLVGFGFCIVLLFSFFTGFVNFVTEEEAPTAEALFHREPEPLALASNGPFGRFDRRQLQRGFQVFREVCSSCHGLTQVHFRDLAELGYSEAAVKKIAADWPVQQASVNPDTGEAATRPGAPPDAIISPYPNEVAARAANNNALPPDLSLITKAREGAAPYVHSLLTGYRKQVGYRNAEGTLLLQAFPDAKSPTGLYFNPWFANLNIAMPPPLTSDGQVSYEDGTASTVDQMSRDVAAFLVWTAEPKLEARKIGGVASLIFLLIFTVLAYMAYKSIWAPIKHARRPVAAE